MIENFADKKTEDIWEGNREKSLPLSIQKKGRLKLRMLNNAQNIADLRIPPGNKLDLAIINSDWERGRP